MLAWLGQAADVIAIDAQSARIILLGIAATNIMFFLITRKKSPQSLPADTITLAQCVVGIAWATLYTNMSSGAEELLIGIYSSAVLFAMLRVSRNVLNQVIVFAVSSYSIVSLVRMLSAQPPALTPTSLMPLLSFAGIMLCLSGASRYIYRRQRNLEARFALLQSEFRRDNAISKINSVNRRYILDLLAREKGRTDRSNVPFCICIFNVDFVETCPGEADEGIRKDALKDIETVIRAELRDMDSLNATGFHNCFGTFSDREFVAILPQTNLDGARHSANRLLTVSKTLRDAGNDRIRLTGGIAQYRRGDSIAQLLARAEEALTRARASGDSDMVDIGDEGVRTEKFLAEIVRLDPQRR